MYETTITCPVCGAVFDVIGHDEPQPNGQMVAMLCGSERRDHGQASPACTQDDRWFNGWNKSTKPAAGPPIADSSLVTEQPAVGPPTTALEKVFESAPGLPAGDKVGPEAVN